MSTSRPLTKIVLGLGSVLSIAVIAACGAPPQSETTSDSTGEAIITKCPLGYSPDCSPEGINGSMLCTCDSPTRPYSDGIATTGLDTMYDGRASSLLWSLGCSTSATTDAYGKGTPYFTCPATSAVQAGLAPISWFGLPPCDWDATNNGPVLPAGATSCEELYYATDLTKPFKYTGALSSPFVGTVASGKAYVWVEKLPQNTDVYGTGCTSGCSSCTHYPSL